jgi:hypothetical protein
MQDVGVIYLYRFAEGETPVRRFVQSYREHSADLAHDFHVILKGFPDGRSLNAARTLFAGIPANFIELADEGFDIGSYAAAARSANNRRILLLNTFSVIQGDHWLQYLNRALSMPGVGLAGATGSWHANASGYEAALKRVFYRIRHLPTFVRVVFSDGSKQQNPMKMRNRRLLRYILSPFEYLYCIYEYGRHPNPHIRTNAFMIDRGLFLSLKFPAFRKKGDVYRFESGRHSLTRQIIAQGLQPVVVGRNGKTYPIAEWKSSLTFWIGDQANLLVADNRTNDYIEGDQIFRDYLEDSAWANPWSWRITTLFRR